MIVVVASGHDPRARSVMEHWDSQRAMMLTAEDLCMPGWQFTVPRPQIGMAVIGGKLVADAEIEGILTLRPCIFPEELLSIAAAHRSYVAAELNAFLLAWLAAQTCPVLNRPTASCLAGPNWRAEQWTLVAARLGIPANPGIASRTGNRTRASKTSKKHTRSQPSASSVSAARTQLCEQTRCVWRGQPALICCRSGFRGTKAGFSPPISGPNLPTPQSPLQCMNHCRTAGETGDDLGVERAQRFGRLGGGGCTRTPRRRRAILRSERCTGSGTGTRGGFGRDRPAEASRRGHETRGYLGSIHSSV